VFYSNFFWKEFLVMRRKAITALLSASVGWSVSSALGQATIQQSSPAATPTVSDLQARLNAMQATIDKLQADQQKQEADQAAVIKQVLADADAQSELASGYDPNVGFVVRSSDGAFSLHPGAVLDFRYLATYRESIPVKGGGATAKTGYDIQNGFEMSRARVTVDGNFTKDIYYFVQADADEGAPVSLLDAYWVYHLGQSPFSVKVGQFKDPLWHERNLSEANLLAVDRSLVESLLGGGQTSRVQGAALQYDQGRLRGQLVIHDGYDSLNDKFYHEGGLPSGVAGGAGVTPTDFGTSGRVEYMLIGDRTSDFNPYREYDGGFTALGDTQNILVVGGGYDYSQAGDNDIIFHTADIQYDMVSGLSLYGAYLGTYRDLHSSQGVTAATSSTPAGPAVPPGNYYDPGLLVQAAYLVTPNIEPFIRYDYAYLAGGSVAEFGLNKSEVQEYTVGANYYLYKQHAKITVDGVWLPDGAPADSDALGVLEDSGHNEFILRAQFQLAL
jgi:hypothetical protein